MTFMPRGPGPIAILLHQSGANRIEMRVTKLLAKLGARVDGAIMSPAALPYAARIVGRNQQRNFRFEVTKKIRDRGLLRRDKKMHVIGHDAPRVHLNFIAGDKLRKFGRRNLTRERRQKTACAVQTRECQESRGTGNFDALEPIKSVEIYHGMTVTRRVACS